MRRLSSSLLLLFGGALLGLIFLASFKANNSEVAGNEASRVNIRDVAAVNRECTWQEAEGIILILKKMLSPIVLY